MHHQLDVETRSERDQKQAELAHKRAEELEKQALAEAERDALEETVQEKDQTVDEGSAQEDDDEIEYDVFYNKLEIKETLKNQKKDIFGDVVRLRKKAVDELKDLEGGPENANKFIIEDWAPKAEDDDKPLNAGRAKKKKDEDELAVEEIMRKHREKEEAAK